VCKGTGEYFQFFVSVCSNSVDKVLGEDSGPSILDSLSLEWVIVFGFSIRFWSYLMTG